MNLIECNTATLTFEATPGEADASWRICGTARDNAARLDLIAYDLDPSAIEAAADYLRQVVHDRNEGQGLCSLNMTHDLFDSLYGTIGSCDEFCSGIDLDAYGVDEALIRQMHDRHKYRPPNAR